MSGPLLPSGKIILPDTTRRPATASTATDWVRPSDWLPMPLVEAYEQKICILHAVFNHDSNFAAFTISGAYTVDWGDGTVDNVNSGATATHAYSYSNSALDGTECSRGYKQAMITITPQSGSNLTSVNFQVKYSAAIATYSSSGFLDVVFSSPSATTITFGGNTPRHARAERVIMLSSGAITSCTSLLASCAALRVFDIDGLNTANVTSFANALNACYSLRSARIAHKIKSACSSISGMLVSCYSLTEFDLSEANTIGVTNASSFAYYCLSLRKLTLGTINTALVQNWSEFVSACYALEELDMTNQSMAAATNVTNFFGGNTCTSLSKLIFPCPLSFEVKNSRLSATALNSLYTSLPTVTGKTIDVTGNYGVTGDDPTIASAKGWTVTG